MLREYVKKPWNELTPFEQGAVLAELELTGGERAHQLFRDAQEQGTPFPPVDCWDYWHEFEDAPPSAKDVADQFEYALDPRVTTFCLALEREKRQLMGSDPILTEPVELARLQDEARKHIGTPDGYSKFFLALMAWHDSTGWSVTFTRSPEGVAFQGESSAAHNNRCADSINGARRLLMTDWDELSDEEKATILADMERIGGSLARQRVEQGDRGPAKVSDFCATFSALGVCEDGRLSRSMD